MLIVVASSRTRPSPGVEPIGGHAHGDGEQERQKTEQRADQHAAGALVLVRVLRLAPTADPEPDLERDQRHQDEAEEDANDRDGIEERLRHQLWAPERLRTMTPSTIRVMPAMPIQPSVSRKNTTPMIAIAAVPMPGPHRVGDAERNIAQRERQEVEARRVADHDHHGRRQAGEPVGRLQRAGGDHLRADGEQEPDDRLHRLVSMANRAMLRHSFRRRRYGRVTCKALFPRWLPKASARSCSSSSPPARRCWPPETRRPRSWSWPLPTGSCSPSSFPPSAPSLEVTSTRRSPSACWSPARSMRHQGCRLHGGPAVRRSRCRIRAGLLPRRRHGAVPALGEGVDVTEGILLEAIMTTVLLFAVFGTAVDSRGPKIGGLAIGLAVAVDILLGATLTGAAMNPARWSDWRSPPATTTTGTCGGSVRSWAPSWSPCSTDSFWRPPPRRRGLEEELAEQPGQAGEGVEDDQHADATTARPDTIRIGRSCARSQRRAGVTTRQERGRDRGTAARARPSRRPGAGSAAATSWVDAPIARMAPSTGPMHGVQPTATSAPGRASAAPTGRRWPSQTGLGTRSRTGPNRPVMSSPRPMTMTPATGGRSARERGSCRSGRRRRRAGRTRR